MAVAMAMATAHGKAVIITAREHMKLALLFLMFELPCFAGERLSFLGRPFV